MIFILIFFISFLLQQRAQNKRYNGLKPIGKEINNLNGANTYALAVVRTPSDVISFDGLRNATSCHSGKNDSMNFIMLIKKP